MQRKKSMPGLGAAMINSHYDHLGGGIKHPPFLKIPKTVSVIGAPLSWGQPLAGTDHGPQLLRNEGLLTCLTGLEWRVENQGDLQFDIPQETDPSPDPKLIGGNAKNCYCVGKGLGKIYDKVLEAHQNGNFALTLGGDHSVAAGSVAATIEHRPETGIIWVDAHGDLNTPATSPSGNMHGMPLGLLLGLCDTSTLPGFEWLADTPMLRPDQIVFVGLRDLDGPERDVIRTMGIRAYTMQHVDKWGIGKVMDMAINHFRGSDGSLPPLHLSYDIDAVDPEQAPATGTVVRGGFNFREAHYIAEAVSETGMLGSMDLVEVNPMLTAGKEAELTCQLGMALIASAMGSRIL